MPMLHLKRYRLISQNLFFIVTLRAPHLGLGFSDTTFLGVQSPNSLPPDWGLWLQTPEIHWDCLSSSDDIVQSLQS